MADKRCDMSATCGMHYDEYWRAAHVDHTMSEDYFKCWFDRNCAKCFYMSDICMYGEGTEQLEESGSQEDDSATTPSDPSSGETQTTTSPASADSTGSQAKSEMYDRIIRSMRLCGWYNGLRDDILILIDHIKRYTKIYRGSYVQCMRPNEVSFDKMEFIEGSYLWMMCVCMFGNYGTSPRYGWLEKPVEAVEFLESILPAPDDEEGDRVGKKQD